MPPSSPNPESALSDLIKAVNDGRSAAHDITQISGNRLTQAATQTYLVKRIVSTIDTLDEVAGIIADRLAKLQEKGRLPDSPIPKSTEIAAIQQTTRTTGLLRDLVIGFDDSLADINRAAEDFFRANVHRIDAILATGINGYSGREIQLCICATAAALKQTRFYLSMAASQKPNTASTVKLDRGPMETRDRYSPRRRTSNAFTKNAAPTHKNLIEALSASPAIIAAANEKLEKAAAAIADYIKTVATPAMVLSAPYNEFRLAISEKSDSQGAYILSTNIKSFVMYFGPYLTIFIRKIAEALEVRENRVQLELLEIK